MKKPLVLIIEDDAWLVEQFKRVLSDEYNVKDTTNAWAAIDLIDELKPEAIILDVLLTGSTAFALLHELQSYGDMGMIPVILCTNLAAEMSVDNLKPYGVVRVLDKTSMHPDDLKTAIRSVL